MSETEAPTIKRALRRTKVEAGISTGSGRMTDERLTWHFLNWAVWMRSGEVTRGYPRQSAGMSAGSRNTNFDDLADASERRVAATCNAVILGLPNAQQMAISHEYLHSVWRFNRTTQAEQLELGREGVRDGLQRRGIW